MLISNNAPFAFRQRRERIDWKILASVDIDKVARDVDFQTLQDNTANVTFCDIQAEVDPIAMDKNFIKLFRLAQLIIEYLIYSQDCLSAALASSEQESSELSKRVAELEEKLKKEKARKKNVDGNPPIVIVDNGNQCKCSYCPKIFFNNTYLRMHHERRHPGQPLTTSADAFATNPAPAVDMETELKAIKEHLKLTEDHLKEEKAALDNAAVKEQNRNLQREAEIRQEMETWKTEQLKTQKQDLENTKNLFQKELDILKETYLTSERQLKELQQKTVPVMAEPKLNPSVLVAEGNETKELMKKQQQEIMELKKILKQQVLNMGNSMQQQLKEQEIHWKSKVSQMEDKYHEEIRKLSEPAAYSKQMDSEQLLNLPDMELSLNRQIKELEKLNILQKNAIEKKKRHSPRKIKKSHVKLHSTPKEDSMTNTQEFNTIHGEVNYSDDQSLASSNFVNTSPLTTFNESVRQNPIIIQGMRDEVSNLLDEKLELLGISKDAEGVRESTLKRKMTSRNNERQELTKKYKSLLSLREQLQFQVDKMANLKLREHKRSSSTPAKAKNSIRKILNSVKKKVIMVRGRSRSPSPAVPPREISLSPLRNLYGNSLGATVESGLSNTQGADSTNEAEEDKEDDSLSDTDMESSSDLEASPRLSPSGNAVGVHALARSLEKQFESRKGKPAGGVNVFPVAHPKQTGSTATIDEATSKSWLKPKTFASTPDTSKKKPPAQGSKDYPENSSAIFVTEAGGLKVSKPSGTQKQQAAEITISPFNSLSSWDSENEISEIS